MNVQRPKIVVADDDPIVAETILEILKRNGYQAVAMDTAEKVLELAPTEQVDAFLLDVEMPGMSGIDLCRRIRRMEQHRATPVMVITGRDAYSDMIEAFSAGCDDFIGKPVSGIVLLTRLKGHLERMNYFRQLQRTRQMLNHYLSRPTLEIVETVARTGSLPPPQERDLTVLFTDIRGFTAISEDTEPAELFDLVSALLGEQVDRVHEFGGYVDKFGGDGVMAVFDGPEMVLQSCLCALRILESTMEKGRLQGKEKWRLGIGIHRGPAIIGNIGSPEHLDYSVIGTTVNLAARLCGQAEATSIVVSKVIRDSARNDSRLQFHSEREVMVRGMKAPVIIYTLSRSHTV